MDEILDVARMQLFERGLPATAAEVDKLLFRIAQRRAMDWHCEAKVALLGGESVTIGEKVVEAGWFAEAGLGGRQRNGRLGAKRCSQRVAVQSGQGLCAPSGQSHGQFTLP